MGKGRVLVDPEGELDVEVKEEEVAIEVGFGFEVEVEDVRSGAIEVEEVDSSGDESSLTFNPSFFCFLMNASASG